MDGPLSFVIGKSERQCKFFLFWPNLGGIIIPVTVRNVVSAFPMRSFLPSASEKCLFRQITLHYSGDKG